MYQRAQLGGSATWGQSCGRPRDSVGPHIGARRVAMDDRCSDRSFVRKRQSGCVLIQIWEIISGVAGRRVSVPRTRIWHRTSMTTLNFSAMLPPLHGMRVADLGCGFGWAARWFRQNGAVSVEGYDLSANMARRARADTDDEFIASCCCPRLPRVAP